MSSNGFVGFTSTDIISREPSSQHFEGNQNLGFQIVRFADGSFGIEKSIKDWTGNKTGRLYRAELLASQEYLAARVGQALNAPIRDCLFTSTNGTTVIMPFVIGQSGKELGGKDVPDDAQGLQLHIFDHLVANSDRRPKNLMFTQNGIIGIDHALCNFRPRSPKPELLASLYNAGIKSNTIRELEPVLESTKPYFAQLQMLDKFENLMFNLIRLVADLQIVEQAASVVKSVEKDAFTPPQSVQEAAQKALEWMKEGKAGSGFTPVGRKRASDLARGATVSEDTIRRMKAYFDRHQPDKKSPHWDEPSPGKVAWYAWGGDAGYSWAKSVVEKLNKIQKGDVPGHDFHGNQYTTIGGVSHKVYWHGSPNGKAGLKVASYGVHVGGYQAAKEALEARIGRRADGKDWDGTEEYGKTLIVSTGAGYGAGDDWAQIPHYPADHQGEAVYSDGTPIAMDSKPDITPVIITGSMKNSVWSPVGDDQANSRMRGQITRNNAKNGYYYSNEGEGVTVDENGKIVNDISAVVPSADHLTVIPKEQVIAKGDLPGHDFHGNQYTDANGHVQISSHYSFGKEGSDEGAKISPEQVGTILGSRAASVEINRLMGTTDSGGMVNFMTGEPALLNSPLIGGCLLTAQALKVLYPNGEIKASVTTSKSHLEYGIEQGRTPMVDHFVLSIGKDRFLDARGEITEPHVVDLSGSLMGGDPKPMSDGLYENHLIEATPSIIEGAQRMMISPDGAPEQFAKWILEQASAPVSKGDVQGHPFHGNQYESGEGGWKPVMTSAEAMEWAKNSAIQVPLYHGTNRPDSIMSEGFRDNTGGGNLINGTWLNDFDPRQSENEVHWGQHTLTVMANVKSVATPEQTKAIHVKVEELIWGTQDRKINPGDEARKIALEQGFDALQPSKGVYIVLNPKNLTVVSDEVKKGDTPGHAFHGNQYERDPELHNKVRRALKSAGHTAAAPSKNRYADRHSHGKGFVVAQGYGQPNAEVQHLPASNKVGREHTDEERAVALQKLAEYKQTLDGAGFTSTIMPPRPNNVPLGLPYLNVSHNPDVVEKTVTASQLRERADEAEANGDTAKAGLLRFKSIGLQAKEDKLRELVEKGDLPGHDFHGNQYTGGMEAIEAWRERRAGNATPKEPKPADKGGFVGLKTTEIAQTLTNREKWGGALNTGFDTVRLKDGSVGVVKHNSDARGADAEVLSARIGKAMGVPIRDAEFIKGGQPTDTLHPYIEGKSVAEAFSKNEISEDERRAIRNSPEMGKIKFFDMITGNIDRHWGNVMLTKDKTIVGIDGGNAFGAMFGHQELRGYVTINKVDPDLVASANDAIQGLFKMKDLTPNQQNIVANEIAPEWQTFWDNGGSTYAKTGKLPA